MKALSAIVPGYPPDHPQTLAELLAAPREAINDQLAWELRSHIVDVVRRQDEHFVNTPWDVFNLTVNGYVFHPWQKAWVSYALNHRRQPLTSLSGPDGRGYTKKATKLLPKQEDLPAVADDVSWIVMYGGNPEVLDKAGVPQGLTRLGTQANLADIVFYAPGDGGQPPTMWSLRSAVGLAGATKSTACQVPFPNEDLAVSLKEAIWTTQ